MPKWKTCPHCGGYIPENWDHHEKCGWNVKKEEVEKIEKDEFLSDMETAILDAFRIGQKIRQKYPDQYKELDMTKIALTLFIQKRREKSPKKSF